MSRMPEGSQIPKEVAGSQPRQRVSWLSRFIPGRNGGKPELQELENREYILFGPLGRRSYSPEAQKRIEDNFGTNDPTRSADRTERLKMWEHYGQLKVRAAELLRSGNTDALSAQQQAVYEISPMAKEDAEKGIRLGAHLKEASEFADAFVLNSDGSSRFQDILTDRQAKLLARFVTPSHDLMKYMAKPNGEDFTADHQMLAMDFMHNVLQYVPGTKVNIGTKVSPELTILTQEDADFIAGVIGDHENILKEEGRREFIHSTSPIERAKAMFFIVDVLTGAIVPDSNEEFRIDLPQLDARFTDLYFRHIDLVKGKIFRPQWGAYTIGDLVETFRVLEANGLKMKNADGKDTKETLVYAALTAIDKAGAANNEREEPKFTSDHLNAIDRAEQQLEDLIGGPRIITAEDLPAERYHEYRKSELTRAKSFTEQDALGDEVKYITAAGEEMIIPVIHRDGQIFIQTLEGEASINVGDAIALGAKNEAYPIRKDTMEATKRQVGESDQNGWTNYETTTTVKGTRIYTRFGVRRVGTDDVSYGKIGDFFVDSGRRQFIVDGGIFSQTYIEVPHSS